MMVSDPPTHPKKRQLVAFYLGKLDEEASAAIAGHLDICPACSETIVGLRDDTFVGLVRDASGAAPAVEDPQQPSRPGPGVEASQPTASLSPPAGTNVSDFGQLPIELLDHPRYKIIQPVGRGGMGDVYKAQHKLMNRTVALKVIKPQLMHNEAAVARFQREVQAAARLDHGNIVTAFDAEQAGNLHFLVMEYVDGVNLNEIVRVRGALPAGEACEIIRQAAAGLQHAHEMGMVHRDIKPHNLMVARPSDAGSRRTEAAEDDLTSQISAKILDFGLTGFANETAADVIDGGKASRSAPVAEVLAELTKMGAMMGTPDYISPEQVREAGAADIRADVYSLGCTFYVLLTGHVPFPDRSVSEKLQAHVEGTPQSVTSFRRDVPASVIAIVEKMMAKDPAERFQSPQEVVEALAACRFDLVETEPERSTPDSTGRKPPLRTSLLLRLGFVAAIAAAIFVFTQRGRLHIVSQVDDVRVVVKQDEEEVRIIDLATGSNVTWLPTGKYELELVGGDNDVVLDQAGFTMSRLGNVIVTAQWSSEGLKTIQSFDPPEQTITRDGVEVADNAWKITADQTRTVRLFEASLPPMQPGPLFYRAKLKTENVRGQAYLEMWVRIPGSGEFFSKGLHQALSGDNGWAEYEIPFFAKSERPDLAKLNVTVEGGGIVWIKDIQVRGRAEESTPAFDPNSPWSRPRRAKVSDAGRPTRVSILTRDGHYWRVPGEGPVRADASEISPDAIFTLEWKDEKSDRAWIIARNGTRVRGRPDRDGKIETTNKKGYSELFTFEWVDRTNHKTRLRTHDGEYVRGTKARLPYLDTVATPKTSEIFTLVPAGE